MPFNLYFAVNGEVHGLLEDSSTGRPGVVVGFARHLLVSVANAGNLLAYCALHQVTKVRYCYCKLLWPNKHKTRQEELLKLMPAAYKYTIFMDF